MNLLFEAPPVTETVEAIVFMDLIPESKATIPVGSPPVATEAELLDASAERFQAELEAACAEAREEMRMSMDGHTQRAVEAERSVLTDLCASFTTAKATYFREVEAEVVKLSLAIASRIMQREAACDPLLLQGVVQVALRKLGNTEGTILHVPAADEGHWQAAMQLTPALRVEIDAAMLPGECRLQTPAGAADLGLRAQLAEVERGFCELLARRPN